MVLLACPCIWLLSARIGRSQDDIATVTVALWFQNAKNLSQFETFLSAADGCATPGLI
jgi:hypothetical protein